VLAYISYVIYRLLGALFGPMPRHVGHAVARPAGWLLYALSPGLRSALQGNMRHVLGPDADEAQVRALARQACINIAKSHYDLFRVSRLTTEEIKDLTQIEGVEHVSRALDEGHGVVLASAHLGNIDVVGQLPTVYGVPLTAPIWHAEPERLFQYWLSLRQSHGLRLIPSDGPMMELFRTLKRGEIVALPCDRAYATSVRLVDFFGTPTYLPDGPVRLALRTGAALIPVFTLRLPDDTFLVRVEPPLELSQTGDRDADVSAGMEKLVSAMERRIAEHPEQWLVAAPVWPAN
jgi:lauroyl/myristoyl acyltransferase